MLYFVVAMPQEARALLEAFSFRRVNLPCRFELYEAEGAVMVVTGQGGKNAGLATAFLFGRYLPTSEEDLLINLGICGCGGQEVKAGTAFQCVRLSYHTDEPGRKKEIYPKWQKELDLPAGYLVTYDHPVTKEQEKDCLVDMEGYHVLKTAELFLEPEQMLAIKVVSDHLSDAMKITAAKITEYIKNTLGPVKAFLAQRQAEDTDNKAEREWTGQWIDRLTAFCKASVGMQSELRGLFSYLELEPEKEAVDAWILEQLKDRDIKTRNDGKIWLNEFRRGIQEAFPVTLSEPVKTKKKHPGLCVYVEEAIWEEQRTAELCSKISKDVQPVKIGSYLDLFTKSRQSFGKQKEDPAILLAKKNGELIYDGAPMCQTHGFSSFAYTSCVMNCVYDCEYCYLQGMYPCGHLVVFTNIEDIFQAAKERAGGKKMYLAVSFDTDLLAMEGMLGYGKRWLEFAKDNPNITVELRTKSDAAIFLREQTTPPDNFILSWSLAPEDEVITPFEHKTASLARRLQAISRAMEMGYSVRLCFDPLLYIPNAKTVYSNLVDLVFATLPKKPWDVSLGGFRLSKDHISRMRKNRPNSALLQYPYEVDARTAKYPDAVETPLLRAVYDCLLSYMPKERIFLWDERSMDR